MKQLAQEYRVVAALDIHAYSQLILYPYGYANGLPDAPNVNDLISVGNQMAAAIYKLTK